MGIDNKVRVTLHRRGTPRSLGHPLHLRIIAHLVHERTEGKRLRTGQFPQPEVEQLLYMSPVLGSADGVGLRDLSIHLDGNRCRRCHTWSPRLYTTVALPSGSAMA